MGNWDSSVIANPQRRVGQAMNEFIKAVEYNIKPILWWLGTVVFFLIIGMAIGTFWFHDVVFPPMTVTDTTQGGYHGITIHPAIVAASKVPAGVIAQITLTMNFPAVHEQATERIGNGNISSNHSNVASDVVDNDNVQLVKTFDFTSRGGGWFTTLGEIYHNPVTYNLIISQLTNGDYQVLTNEDGVSFTVKSAVAVEPKSSWIRTGISAGYDGKGNLSANGDLLLWQHIPINAGFRTDNTWQVKAGWLW